MHLNISDLLYGLMSLFFGFTFLESGVDKILNKDGNLSWFKEQFSKSIIKGFITPSFYWIMIQELALGIFLLFICVNEIFHFIDLGVFGYIYSLFLLIQLFVGQRLAKDYAGAAGIVPYIILAFLVCILYSFR